VGRAIVAALAGSSVLSLARPLSRIASYWRDLGRHLFGDYRPERHYMRGPGPACRAKYGNSQTLPGKR
jgi:hypothetical protein